MLSKPKKYTNKNQEPERINVIYYASDLLGIQIQPTVKPRKYTRSQARNFLKDPYSYYKQLQELSQYLKATSGNYFRTIKYFANLLTLDYILYPYINTNKFENKERVLNSFENVLLYIDKMNIKYNFRWILERLIENGEIYLYKLQDKNGIIYKELPSKYCRISEVVDNVCLYEINLSYISSSVLDEYPPEIQEAYQKNKGKKGEIWYQVSENGFAFNAISPYLPHGYPPLSFLFDDVMSLDDTKDLFQDQTKLDAIKLIHQKMPLDKDNKPIFDKNVADIYHKATKKNLPDGIAVTTNPFELTSINFDKIQKKEIDIIDRTEKNIFNSAGISSLLFNNDKASGEALKRSIITDESLMYPFLYMFANYINYDLKKVSPQYRWKMKFLETTYFNRMEFIKQFKDNLSMGGSRMIFMSCCGFEPIEYINVLKTEQNILDIDNLMIPISTSYTQSGDDKGRPKQDEIKETGEKTREQK